MGSLLSCGRGERENIHTPVVTSYDTKPHSSRIEKIDYTGGNDGLKEGANANACFAIANRTNK